MYAFESPVSPGPISTPTLVAITTSSRPPLFSSQFPMMVSDSPPLCPGIHFEYTSAVSIRFSPEATNASRILNDVGSSAVHPKTLPPSASGPTSNPVFPSLRLIMSVLLFHHFAMNAATILVETRWQPQLHRPSRTACRQNRL